MVHYFKKYVCLHLRVKNDRIFFLITRSTILRMRKSRGEKFNITHTFTIFLFCFLLCSQCEFQKIDVTYKMPKKFNLTQCFVENSFGKSFTIYYLQYYQASISSPTEYKSNDFRFLALYCKLIIDYQKIARLYFISAPKKKEKKSARRI